MKKIVVFSLLFPLISFASFDRDLFYGLRQDSDVERLQEFLTEQGVYQGPITGNFFSLTLKAAKDFQLANLISPISGYFGPLSRAKANALLSSQGISDSSVTTETGTAQPVIITTPKTTEDVVASLKEQIASLKEQIILLRQQNQTLQNQLQALQTTNQLLGQIQTNTTPVPSPAPPPPPPEIDKSDLIIREMRSSRPDPLNNLPYGEYIFLVSVLDKEGKYRNDVLIVPTYPADNLYSQLGRTKIGEDAGPRYPNGITDRQLQDSYANFSYVPTNPGTKTITFTSGFLTRSDIIEVSQ